MARFRTHISFGAIAGIVFAVFGALVYSLTGFHIYTMLFLCAVLGAFLPDIDSDSGRPFQITFGLLSLAGAAIVYTWTVQNGQDLAIQIGAAAVALIVIRFGVGTLFKKFTKHRGIFHSIPMAVIFSLLGLMIADNFPLTVAEQVLIGSAIGIGFLSHLILDEVYATINFDGKTIGPNKYLGSALEFFDYSKKATFVMYLVLFVLLFLNWDTLQEFIGQ